MAMAVSTMDFHSLVVRSSCRRKVGSAGIYAGIYRSRVEEQVSTGGSRVEEQVSISSRAGEAERMEPTDEEPLAKKKKGEKGYPPGIFAHRSGKLQARLPGFKVDGRRARSPFRACTTTWRQPSQNRQRLSRSWSMEGQRLCGVCGRIGLLLKASATGVGRCVARPVLT